MQTVTFFDTDSRPSRELFQIEGVYEGRSVFIDWRSGLEPAIRVHYSTPAGDPLVHLAPDPVFMANLPGWAFHRFNPWRERFDQLIQRTVEAGLVDFWKQVNKSNKIRRYRTKYGFKGTP